MPLIVKWVAFLLFLSRLTSLYTHQRINAHANRENTAEREFNT